MTKDNLKQVGLALYWAEGIKVGNTVQFSNADPDMIRIFLRFLREVYNVDESRLKVHLQIKDVHDVQKVKVFWSRVTKIDQVKFYKPTITKANPLKGDKKYLGTCRIVLPDSVLQKKILSSIDELRTVVCHLTVN